MLLELARFSSSKFYQNFIQGCYFVGMLPPFSVQSDEIKAAAKHCTIGIEPRVSAERFILLDVQVCAVVIFSVFTFFLFLSGESSCLKTNFV